jgi:putative NADPH-quinone reductase
MPALLKGFFDRIFLPGFAFKFEGKSFLPKQYLKGKSARIITTAGGPWWYYFIFGNPSIASIKRITLAFCGVSPIKTKGFYDIKRVSQERAEKILFKVRKMARRDLS